jgi:pseudaminic acid synthase
MGETVQNDDILIIAELSANHNGSLELAKETIYAMRESGADAVKLQTYTPDTITLNCANEYFQVKQGTIWDGKTLYELYKEAMTPWEWHEELFDLANSLGMRYLSSPFDSSAVDFLEQFDVCAYKIASFEITDTNLISYTAAKQKPMIISTGIATLEDIALALQCCKDMGNSDITLLKCTSSYPAQLCDMNLATIRDLKSRFGVKVGLSDHTTDSVAPIVAASLGASVIEKHFILDRKLGGVDSKFSLEPDEFKKMVSQLRQAKVVLGGVTYELDAKAKRSREFARSLFVAQDVKKGEVLTHSNIRSVRPFFGAHPKYLKEILGKKASRDLAFGEPFLLDMM